MKFLGSLLSGIVSGLLTVAIVEGYLWLRRSYVKRKLRAILAIPEKECTILCGSLFGYRGRRSLIALNESFGLAHLLEMCRHINITPRMFPGTDIPRDFSPSIISVGGPVSNPVTALRLRNDCPGFEPYYSSSSVDTAEGKLMDGWRCGGREFSDSEDEHFGFLVKLTPSITELSSVVHLAFGLSGVGTAAAAFYLSKYYEKIFDIYAGGPYFFAVRVSPMLGYQAVSPNPIDLTSHALNRNVGATHS